MRPLPAAKQRPQVAVVTSLFLAIMTMPLFLYVLVGNSGDIPIQRLGTVLGDMAISAMLATLVISAKLKPLSLIIGPSNVTHLHRYLGVGTAALVVMHVGLAVAVKPDLILPWGGTPASEMGVRSFIALLALLACTRLPRKKHKLWRGLHIGMALTVFTLGALHIWWVNNQVKQPLTLVWLVTVLMAIAGVLVYGLWWKRRKPRKKESASDTQVLAADLDRTVRIRIDPHSRISSSGRHVVSPSGKHRWR